MVAAKFDAKKDLELQCAPRPSRKPSMCRLLKNMNDTTINLMFMFVLILLSIAAGLLIYSVAADAWSKNYAAIQLVELGPNGPVKVGKSCGGVINVKMNVTTEMQLNYMIQTPAVVSCLWIIQSDAKMVNLTWTNGRNHTTRNGDELLVGELIDNELHNCRNIGEASRTTTTIHTPAILQIQPPATSQAAFSDQTTFLAYSQISFTPIASAGTHTSEPATHNYNIVSHGPGGSLAISNDGSHGVLTNLESDNNRQLICSSGNEGAEQCCKPVKAYKFNSTNDASSSCTAVSMLNDLSKQESVLVLLSSRQDKAYGPSCQVQWEKYYFKAS